LLVLWVLKTIFPWHFNEANLLHWSQILLATLWQFKAKIQEATGCLKNQ
jgi:hypothetical protein